MAAILREPTLYVLSRSSARFASQKTELENLNSGCKVIFIQVEISLLAEVDAACQQTLAAEKWMDCLYMSPGLIPFNGQEFTKEGLEICFALSYYSRMRLTSNLLPLLSQSPQPKILRVLNGGNEKSMIDNDLGLEKNWSPLTVINHTTTMTSFAFNYLADSHKQITFMHVYPGWVQTDISARLAAPESSGVLWRITLAAIRGAVAVIMGFSGVSAEESGERNAYCFTSDSFGPGSWRIDNATEKVFSPGVMGSYREHGWPEKIWDYTVHVFERALSKEHLFQLKSDGALGRALGIYVVSQRPMAMKMDIQNETQACATAGDDNGPAFEVIVWYREAGKDLPTAS